MNSVERFSRIVYSLANPWEEWNMRILNKKGNFFDEWNIVDALASGRISILNEQSTVSEPLLPRWNQANNGFFETDEPAQENRTNTNPSLFGGRPVDASKKGLIPYAWLLFLYDLFGFLGAKHN